MTTTEDPTALAGDVEFLTGHYGAEAVALGQKVHAANMARNPSWCGSLTGAVAAVASLAEMGALAPVGEQKAEQEWATVITECRNPKLIGHRDVTDEWFARLNFGCTAEVHARQRLASLDELDGMRAVLEVRTVTTIRGPWQALAATTEPSGARGGEPTSEGATPA